MQLVQDDLLPDFRQALPKYMSFPQPIVLRLFANVDMTAAQAPREKFCKVSQMTVSGSVSTSVSHNIYRSPIKLTVMTAIILGFATVLGFVAYARFADRARVPLDHTIYWLIGLSGFAVLLFCVRVLPLWKHVASPAISLSADGITFPGHPTASWGDITENDWHSLSVIFITAGATVVVRTRGRRMGSEAMTLTCGADEYFALCDKFRARVTHHD
ncbi:hypothetical protein [uncultured Agrobacterium sp.]|uniref:hypothetical protein n=1 Tax=uncultured Agrobacterium sp. TaxID=157277 RepID=UPI0025E09BE8|nr:hypothetical protein [uncultured Agrobacterium sp.]